MAYDFSELWFLVVDPNSFRRMLICDVLRALGINQIEPMDDVFKGYNVYRMEQFDIIISEQFMLPLDGLDLTRMIRNSKDSPNPSIPILMITSAPSMKDVVEARDAGVTEYMVMPFSVTAFCRRLVAIIEQPREFVRYEDYFGPDRRRSIKDFLGEDQRLIEA